MVHETTSQKEKNMESMKEMALRFCNDMIKNLRRNVGARRATAQERFAAHFCPHGIVDTGWCEECHGENCNAGPVRNPDGSWPY